MSSDTPRYLVTAAGGQLGQLVIDGLLRRVAPSQVVATVRSDPPPGLAALGIEIRTADYERPETLAAAFAGIDRLLLVSSNELGRRVEQHGNAIAAAREAGVGLVAYTSLLHADRSPLGILAREHLASERLLAASGLPYVLLRNGWYTENYFGFIPSALQYGGLSGSAGDGRIASATRADYADAAVAVLTAADPASGTIHELAGDTAYTLAEWARTLAELSGKPVAYRDMPEAAYRDFLVQVGLPEPLAAMLANSDAGAAQGGLYDDSGTLSRLIGRPTTPLRAAMASALGD